MIAELCVGLGLTAFGGIYLISVLLQGIRARVAQGPVVQILLLSSITTLAGMGMLVFLLLQLEHTSVGLKLLMWTCLIAFMLMWASQFRKVWKYLGLTS